MEKVKIGIIGCGNISGIYLENLTNMFDLLEIKGCCDLIQERALKKQEEFGFEVIYEKDVDVVADPEIDIVLVLTQPQFHYELCMMALEGGKNVYCEKPLSLNRKDGIKIKELAKSKGLLAGGAPDTFLGAGIQTCRNLIEEGWIGKPIAASANLMCHGHESWHPDPEFYYQLGGGPMFDMGPYYLTALVNLLGPIASVAGSTVKAFDQRTITSEKKFGNKVDVEVPTHITGILNFESGAVGTIVTSFDIWKHNMPFIEIYGTEGTISVPDPNNFGGPVKYQKQTGEWYDMPVIYEYPENSRGLGLCDMAVALRTKRAQRASVDVTYHVLDVMEGLHDASDQGVVYKIKSTCAKPVQMAKTLLKGEVK
jgi:predicted dehydrogenase